MDLSATKQRIELEKKQGDITRACKNVGVSDTVFRTAMKKCNYDHLTTAEATVLLEVIRILDNRNLEKEEFMKATKKTP